MAQDGLERLERWMSMAWPRIDALFIGGSTDWKLGPAARTLVREAKRRGLWVHMGRVNSLKRIAYAAEIGCDSIDGTGWMRWRSIRLPEGLQAVSAPPQHALPGLDRDAAGDLERSAA
jgi:hypothetical protein